MHAPAEHNTSVQDHPHCWKCALHLETLYFWQLSESTANNSNKQKRFGSVGDCEAAAWRRRFPTQGQGDFGTYPGAAKKNTPADGESGERVRASTVRPLAWTPLTETTCRRGGAVGEKKSRKEGMKTVLLS